MRNGLKTALIAGAVMALGVTGYAGAPLAYENNGYYQHHGGHYKHGNRHRYKHDGRHYGHKRSYKGHNFKRLMERFDGDGDNALTQDELNTARKELLGKHDGDKNGQLSLEEFKMLWLEFMHKNMVRGFQHLDKDGDAIISADEFVEPFSEAVRHMDRNSDGVLNDQDRRHGAKTDSSDEETQDEQ